MAQDYGFRYSLPKKNLERRDPQDVGFSSTINTLKTYISGIVSKLATHGTTTTIEVPHGLGYRPAFNGYYRDSTTGEVYQIASGFEANEFSRSATDINVHARSDNYNLTFNIWNDNASLDKNVDIFYEVFYEDLTTEPSFIGG